MTYIDQNRAEETINDAAPIAKVPCPTLHNSTLFSAQISFICFFIVKYFPIQISNLRAIQPKDIMQFLKFTICVAFSFLHLTFEACLLFESPCGSQSTFQKVPCKFSLKRVFLCLYLGSNFLKFQDLDSGTLTVQSIYQKWSVSSSNELCLVGDVTPQWKEAKSLQRRSWGKCKQLWPCNLKPLRSALQPVHSVRGTWGLDAARSPEDFLACCRKGRTEKTNLGAAGKVQVDELVASIP